jgi:hypothetical protein
MARLEKVYVERRRLGATAEVDLRRDGAAGVMSAKTGGTRATAEGAAKANCLPKKAGGCKVVAWACKQQGQQGSRLSQRNTKLPAQSASSGV